MDKVLDVLANGGIALGVVAYWMYRDNKYTNNLVNVLSKLQADIELLPDKLKNIIMKRGDKS